MAHKVFLNTFNNNEGILTVFEKILPFSIDNLEILLNKEAQSAKIKDKFSLNSPVSLLVMQGTCEILCNGKDHFLLDNSAYCILLEANEAFEIKKYSNDCIFLLIKMAKKSDQ